MSLSFANATTSCSLSLDNKHFGCLLSPFPVALIFRSQGGIRTLSLSLSITSHVLKSSIESYVLWIKNSDLILKKLDWSLVPQLG